MRPKLRLDISSVPPTYVGLTTLEYRLLQPGEEEKLAQIQNSCFEGTWGYNPNSVEEISYHINLASCCPQDVVLACDGDKVVGYCWTRTIYEADTNERKGQVFMLGLAPDYRGKGIGKEVLAAGLSCLKSRGLRVAELTVDSRNKAACILYRSFGFKVQTSTLWYEKRAV